MTEVRLAEVAVDSWDGDDSKRRRIAAAASNGTANSERPPPARRGERGAVKEEEPAGTVRGRELVVMRTNREDLLRALRSPGPTRDEAATAPGASVGRVAPRLAPRRAPSEQLAEHQSAGPTQRPRGKRLREEASPCDTTSIDAKRRRVVPMPSDEILGRRVCSATTADAAVVSDANAAARSASNRDLDRHLAVRRRLVGKQPALRTPAAAADADTCVPIDSPADIGRSSAAAPDMHAPCGRPPGYASTSAATSEFA